MADFSSVDPIVPPSIPAMAAPSYEVWPERHKKVYLSKLFLRMAIEPGPSTATFSACRQMELPVMHEK